MLLKTVRLWRKVACALRKMICITFKLFLVANLLQQTVAYMKPITLPNRSKAVTGECGSKFTIVSYDLAIAKIAKQIQCTDYPEFENVFIQFGQFHTETNVF